LFARNLILSEFDLSCENRRLNFMQWICLTRYLAVKEKCTIAPVLNSTPYYENIWGPPDILFSGYLGLFPRVNAAGA
jgi:hypothetical protein